jgi:hypothetical protein
MGKPATRREHKAAVRARREAEARARARRERRRRLLLLAGAGLAGYALIVFIGRAPGAQALPTAAAEAGRTAACTNLELAPQLEGDVPRDHFPTGQATSYPEAPPAAGNHAIDPLEPAVRVLETPPDEARLVHTLEHGSVFISYRPPGDPAGLPQETIDALAALAPTRPATYVAPSASLPDGAGLALRAWNVAVTCPGSITASQATVLAEGFVTALACTSNAPEGTLGDGC